jgi:hypothetical protein
MEWMNTGSLIIERKVKSPAIQKASDQNLEQAVVGVPAFSSYTKKILCM